MRIGYIDALKGFAILCVVLGHVLSEFFIHDVYVGANPVMFGIYNGIYAFHMPLFMMLNGYVYCEAYPIERNPAKRSKLYQQIGNLVTLYVMNSIAFGIFKLLFRSSGLVQDTVTLADVLMIWIRPIRGFWVWYFYVLVILYCLFSWKSLRQIDKRYMLCILTALSLISERVTVSVFQLPGVLFFALFFYIGMLIHEKPEWFARKNGRDVFAAFLIAIILCAIFWYRGPYTKEAKEFIIRHFPVVSTIVGVCLSLSVWKIFQNNRFFAENRFLQTVGRYTLEIYLIHNLFSSVFRSLLPRIGVTNALLGVVISSTVSTAIPVLFALFTKRLKIHDLLFRPVTYFAGRRAQKENAQNTNM